MKDPEDGDSRHRGAEPGLSNFSPQLLWAEAALVVLVVRHGP